MREAVRAASENRERITTWRGRCDVERSVNPIGAAPRVQRSTVSFAFDREQDAVRSRTVLEDPQVRSREDGDRETLKGPAVYAHMRKAGVFYRLATTRSAGDEAAEQGRHLTISKEDGNRFLPAATFSPDDYFHRPGRKHPADLLGSLDASGDRLTFPRCTSVATGTL